VKVLNLARSALDSLPCLSCRHWLGFFGRVEVRNESAANLTADYRRSAMLKYLRIAVTALSLVACVLLLALWLYSDEWGQWVSGRMGKQQMVTFGSLSGVTSFTTRHEANPAAAEYFGQWEFSSGRSTVQRPAWQFEAHLRFPVTIRIHVPHWFWVLIVGSIGVVPWSSWSRRFSLRTLLIATTLVAVGMGFVVLSS
jgi:hypothetical protein